MRIFKSFMDAHDIGVSVTIAPDGVNFAVENDVGEIFALIRPADLELMIANGHAVKRPFLVQDNVNALTYKEDYCKRQDKFSAQAYKEGYCKIFRSDVQQDLAGQFWLVPETSAQDNRALFFLFSNYSHLSPEHRSPESHAEGLSPRPGAAILRSFAGRNPKNYYGDYLMIEMKPESIIDVMQLRKVQKETPKRGWLPWTKRQREWRYAGVYPAYGYRLDLEGTTIQAFSGPKWEAKLIALDETAKLTQATSG